MKPALEGTVEHLDLNGTKNKFGKFPPLDPDRWAADPRIWQGPVATWAAGRKNPWNPSVDNIMFYLWGSDGSWGSANDGAVIFSAFFSWPSILPFQLLIFCLGYFPALLCSAVMCLRFGIVVGFFNAWLLLIFCFGFPAISVFAESASWLLALHIYSYILGAIRTGV